jgi:hypothetical protein
MVRTSNYGVIKGERLPIVFFALLCLLSGLWSGLHRIGWDINSFPLAPHHGAIMVGGFLGTLISFEKIIPLKKKGLYVIPIFSALSLVFFFFGQPKIAMCVLVVASTALSLVFLYYFRQQRSVIYVLMFIGAMCWFIGNVLVLTKSFYPLAFPWWAAFALFIIAAERLELMKFLPVKQLNKIMFVLFLLSFLAGVLFSFHGIGNLICGFALIATSVWLMRNDVIGINIKKVGLPKFVAIALCTGYTAMLMTGIFFFSLSDQWLNYDAIVHTFFLGFVFSMIFAHGPMILPGVMGISATPFSKVFYVWLAVLQLSWLLRIFADASIAMELRKLSGLISAVSILGYFITLAVVTIQAKRNAKVL